MSERNMRSTSGVSRDGGESREHRESMEVREIRESSVYDGREVRESRSRSGSAPEPADKVLSRISSVESASGSTFRSRLGRVMPEWERRAWSTVRHAAADPSDALHSSLVLQLPSSPSPSPSPPSSPSPPPPPSPSSLISLDSSSFSPASSLLAPVHHDHKNHLTNLTTALHSDVLRTLSLRRDLRSIQPGRPSPLLAASAAFAGATAAAAAAADATGRQGGFAKGAANMGPSVRSASDAGNKGTDVPGDAAAADRDVAFAMGDVATANSDVVTANSDVATANSDVAGATEGGEATAADEGAFSGFGGDARYFKRLGGGSNASCSSADTVEGLSTVFPAELSGKLRILLVSTGDSSCLLQGPRGERWVAEREVTKKGGGISVCSLVSHYPASSHCPSPSHPLPPPALKGQGVLVGEREVVEKGAAEKSDESGGGEEVTEGEEKEWKGEGEEEKSEEVEEEKGEGGREGGGKEGSEGGIRWEQLALIWPHLVITIVPMENVNGRKKVEAGELCERRNGRGVDINRNWDCDWGVKEKDYNPLEEAPGTHAFSEPEAEAMRRLAVWFRPHVWVNVHSGMEALFTPLDHRGDGVDANTLAAMHSPSDSFLPTAVLGVSRNLSHVSTVHPSNINLSSLPPSYFSPLASPSWRIKALHLPRAFLSSLSLPSPVSLRAPGCKPLWCSLCHRLWRGLCGFPKPLKPPIHSFQPPTPLPRLPSSPPLFASPPHLPSSPPLLASPPRLPSSPPLLASHKYSHRDMLQLLSTMAL
ncbi:unnamed protein product [Closterium sp. NIES-53]